MLFHPHLELSQSLLRAVLPDLRRSGRTALRSDTPHAIVQLPVGGPDESHIAVPVIVEAKLHCYWCVNHSAPLMTTMPSSQGEIK